jgi:hypothetical protein
MEYPDEQIKELKGYCSELSTFTEGGIAYLEMKDLRLPAGCTPATCDALLCPATGQSNYPSRLWLACKVTSAYDRNWNGNLYAGGRNWVAFSWTIQPAATLAQMLLSHMTGFTRKA